jgi:serine phosphatase RsbU (regulator of sigma subunit)
MSQRSARHSLTAKLAYLMTIVVLLSVIPLTLQFTNKFSAYILQTIEESTNVIAERSSADISGILEGWIGQLSVTTSKMTASKTDAQGNDLELQGAMRAERDFIIMKLYLIDGKNYKILRQAQQTIEKSKDMPLKPDQVKSLDGSMNELANFLALNPGRFEGDRFVKNVSPRTETPTALIAVRFRIPGQTSKFAMMMAAATMTKIQLSLPQSRTTTGYVITTDGSIFASTNEQRLFSKKPVEKHELVKMALLRRAPSGFSPEFSGADGKAKIGSFAQTPKGFRLLTIVERDRAAAFQVVQKTYIRSALWGVLIFLLAAMTSFISANGITKNLRDLVSATAKIASGNFSVRVQPRSSDEVSELSHSVNNMATRIQMLMSQEVEKARFEKELETARMVQSTFFPKKDIVKTHLAVTGSYQPATECGGDLWGHYTIKEGVELVYIADAMGHGAPAALVTAIAYAVCQSVSIFLSENSGLDPSPAALLRRLNSIIMDAVDGKISMTFFVAVFDFNTGKVTYANAGHNFPFILTGNKDDPRLGKSAKKMSQKMPTVPITVTLQGTPLGVDKEITYNEKSMDFYPGDKIFLFTDGLIENQLVDRDPIGRKVLVDAVSAWGDQNILEIKSRTLSLGQQFFGSENLQDDVTIVVAEVSKAWVRPSNVIINNMSEPQTVPPPPPQAIAPIPVIQELALDLDDAKPQTLPVFDLGIDDDKLLENTESSTPKKPLSAV